MNDIVKSYNEKVLAESQTVAKRFDKEHPDLLRKIENIIEDLTLQNCGVKDYFIPGTFVNERNRKYKNYRMTRDGFSLVAMSLTGPKAMKFKVMFIDAFNRMEKALKQKTLAREIGIETRKTLTARVEESGENERMHGHGFSTYTKFAYKTIGVKYVKPGKGGPAFRDTLDPGTLERLKIVESMIKALLDIGNEYGEVKKTITEIYETQKMIKG